jgi:hypothetical protein
MNKIKDAILFNSNILFINFNFTNIINFHYLDYYEKNNIKNNKTIIENILKINNINNTQLDIHNFILFNELFDIKIFYLEKFNKFNYEINNEYDNIYLEDNKNNKFNNENNKDDYIYLRDKENNNISLDLNNKNNNLSKIMNEKTSLLNKEIEEKNDNYNIFDCFNFLSNNIFN